MVTYLKSHQFEFPAATSLCPSAATVGYQSMSFACQFCSSYVSIKRVLQVLNKCLTKSYISRVEIFY